MLACVQVMAVGAGGQVGTKFVEAAGLVAAVAPALHHVRATQLHKEEILRIF